MKRLIYYGSTNTGKQRKENQDAYSCTRLWDEHKVLLLVADGVGGYAGGERAAAIAKASIEKYMRSPKGDLLTMIREAAIYANNQILEERKKNPQHFEMCCVFTAVVADGEENKLHFAHVGDTRLYRFRDGVLQKLTKDHSFVGIREDAGELSEKEAMSHPQRNQILREAGSVFHRIDDEDWMDSGTRDFNYNDLLLVCSDGLTDVITSGQISAVLQAGQPLKEKVTQLIDMANEAGGFDNITVVLARNKNNKLVRVGITSPVNTIEKNDPLKSTAKKPAKKWMTSKLLVKVVLLLIFCGGTAWYFYSLKPTVVNGTFISSDGVAQTLPHNEIKVTDSARENHLYTGKSANPANPLPQLIEQADTMLINGTKKFAELKHHTDSSHKKLLLVPGTKNPEYPAMEVEQGSSSADTVVIKNFHFRDFDNAIHINSPAAIVLQNTTFENIRRPVTYGKKSGAGKKSLIISSNSD